jgi:hypothetical protein
VAGKRLLHGDGARQRGAGVRERDHEAVTQGLDFLTAADRHGVAQQGEVGSAQFVRRVLTQTGKQLRRSDQIREEDRHETH